MTEIEIMEIKRAEIVNNKYLSIIHNKGWLGFNLDYEQFGISEELQWIKQALGLKYIHYIHYIQ